MKKIIKAMDVSGEDYAFYANYSRKAQELEFREGFNQDIGREVEYERIVTMMTTTTVW
jgi:hypothetical protein